MERRVLNARHFKARKGGSDSDPHFSLCTDVDLIVLRTTQDKGRDINEQVDVSVILAKKHFEFRCHAWKPRLKY